ncbi:hypothetical protein PENSPDRAFT_509101 [Peniophora sp. CONT]|nr:hypothetical protein PENSPDRAFT_509101 [Peniophora sp. CONT]
MGWRLFPCPLCATWIGIAPGSAVPTGEYVALSRSRTVRVCRDDHAHTCAYHRPVPVVCITIPFLPWPNAQHRMLLLKRAPHRRSPGKILYLLHVFLLQILRMYSAYRRWRAYVGRDDHPQTSLFSIAHSAMVVPCCPFDRARPDRSLHRTTVKSGEPGSQADASQAPLNLHPFSSLALLKYLPLRVSWRLWRAA